MRPLRVTNERIARGWSDSLKPGARQRARSAGPALSTPRSRLPCALPAVPLRGASAPPSASGRPRRIEKPPRARPPAADGRHRTSTGVKQRAGDALRRVLHGLADVDKQNAPLLEQSLDFLRVVLGDSVGCGMAHGAIVSVAVRNARTARPVPVNARPPSRCAAPPRETPAHPRRAPGLRPGDASDYLRPRVVAVTQPQDGRRRGVESDAARAGDEHRAAARRRPQESVRRASRTFGRRVELFALMLSPARARSGSCRGASGGPTRRAERRRRGTESGPQVRRTGAMPWRLILR